MSVKIPPVSHKLLTYWEEEVTSILTDFSYGRESEQGYGCTVPGRARCAEGVQGQDGESGQHGEAAQHARLGPRPRRQDPEGEGRSGGGHWGKP